MNEFHFVIYPKGDRTKLDVATLTSYTSWEKKDYALASNKEFPILKDAQNYAKELAKKHNLIYAVQDDGILDE